MAQPDDFLPIPGHFASPFTRRRHQNGGRQRRFCCVLRQLPSRLPDRNSFSVPFIMAKGSAFASNEARANKGAISNN
jgi:hypothetical protein